jgi:ATP-binding cassette subfamily B protein
MEKSSKSQIKITEVFKIFWQGMRGSKLLFYFCAITFAIGNIVQLIVPIYYKRFFDTVGEVGDKSQTAPVLINIIIVIAILHAIVWLVYRGGNFATNFFETRTIAKLKQISFDYTMNHSYSFFANNFAGSLVQKVNRLGRAFEDLADSLLYSIIPLSINIFGSILIVYFTNPLIAYVIIVWIGIFLAFNYIFSIWKLKYDEAAAAADSKTGGFLSDTISNQTSITLFTGFAHESKGFKDVSNDQAKKSLFTWNLSSIVDSVQVGLMFLVEFIIFYYAIRFWEKGIFTVGTFVLIQVYFLRLSDQLWGFSRLIRTVYRSFADSKEMVEVLLTPHEIKDAVVASVLTVPNGVINFENVSFSFNETRTVLKGIDLTINDGEKIALVGPSGAGKSTFVRLLLRLYEVGGGTIKIDGQNIAKVTQESLRRNISLVPQDPVLFHRTLLENIRYGRKDATDEEVIAAAKLAHCDEFVDSLPLKYDTYVGERGIKLSGGERQRVAIARAILKNAPILILDEATSSLDSHSEMLIQDALDMLMKGKTTIVIAHRLSTIRKMDRIIVIDNGVIAEEGNHDVLLKNETSLYKRLWELQAGGFLKEENEEVEEIKETE